MMKVTTLSDWANLNEPNIESIYYELYWQQINFIQYRLVSIFYNEWRLAREKTIVINEFIKRTTLFPITKIDLMQMYNLEIRIKFEMFKWTATLYFYKPFNFYMEDLLDTDQVEKIVSHVEKKYKKDKNYHKKFILHFKNNYRLFTFFLLLRNQLKLKQ